MSEWISVNDKLPVNSASEMNGNYFCCEVIVFGSCEVATALFSCGICGKWWYSFKFSGVDVTNQITHWMPLPEPPEAL